MPRTKGGALSLVAAWETWYLPRPQPVDQVLIVSPDAWELDAHYPDGFGQPIFPSNNAIIGYLSPSKGNLWKLLYDTMNTTSQKYWKYAHHYAVQNSLTDSEYYSWDKLSEELLTVDLSDVTWTPPKQFDPRFYYYSQETNLTKQLSTEECRETTEEKEVAKTGLYSMNELPSLELKLIPDESQLTTRGRKRGPEGDINPPPQRGRKGGARGPSVPPGSSRARAREWAEAQKSQEMKGKGSTKGTFEEKGKQFSAMGKGSFH